MRKHIKKNILDIFETLYEAHSSLEALIASGEIDTVQSLLGDCQNAAVRIGDIIEESEGEGNPVIPLLEEYCEDLYNAAVKVNDGCSVLGNTKDIINGSLSRAENGVINIKVKYEAVFMPYKASMWDSLESVWKAADADSDYDVYVVPIPYFDKNQEGKFETYHYEGELFPDYVPIVNYKEFDLKNHRPDVIYIHNPYDYENYTTSVDPEYYSDKLKQATDLLVYIPYFATTGGMSEYQATCPAYYNADYIVVQAKDLIKFYDNKLNKDKFLSFGSPKFDRVIEMCRNRPEPPAEWKEQIEGKRVYFYNTSIGGMLDNTDMFMKKLRYVFSCFENRKDVCIIWRPHPMLESTIASSRPKYLDEFSKIKKYYIDNNIGIYDETPDITCTIAVSDAYIGDAGTSVTSLFGVAGKPLFILNNNIDVIPDKEDIRAVISLRLNKYSDIKWQINNRDMLYYSADGDFRYKYVCSLSDYASNYQYSTVITVNNKHYACPANAYNILQVNEHGIVKKFELPHLDCDRAPFLYGVKVGRYIFLIPNYYPAIVRFDTQSDQIKLIAENVHLLPGRRDNIRIIGGSCVFNGLLFIGSTVDGHAMVIDPETCSQQILAIKTDRKGGCFGMTAVGKQIWITPFEGKYILAWNPVTGCVKEYSDFPENYRCIPPFPNVGGDARMFGAIVRKDTVYLPPIWSNMFLKLDTKTGKITEWKTPFNAEMPYKNSYYKDGSAVAGFLDKNILGLNTDHIYLCHDRKMYSADVDKGEYTPVDFEFSDMDKWCVGFDKIGEYLRYACLEDVFNSLDDFLNNNITGKPFDKEEEISAYTEIAENLDGTCGLKVHSFIKEQLMNL